MNGGADLGGMMGFGPVVVEDNEPNFHAEWEPRVMAMTVSIVSMAVTMSMAVSMTMSATGVAGGADQSTGK